MSVSPVCSLHPLVPSSGLGQPPWGPAALHEACLLSLRIVLIPIHFFIHSSFYSLIDSLIDLPNVH